MDTNKNSYTIIYATVLVVVVAAVLAFVSQSLKDRQQKNIDVEKKTSLLSSVGLAQEAATASNKLNYIETEYDKYITDSYIVNSEGNKVEGEAFRVDLKEQYNLMKQIDAAPEAQKQELAKKLSLPVFVCTMPDGRVVNIFSCYGAGLWGPIWGYLGVDADFNTLAGAIFDHKGETPGLGAEIATERFRNQFNGKQIFDNGTFTSISIVKGGADPDNTHEVDAISGGTITSRSLDATIRMWLGYYNPYIMKEIAKSASPATEEVAEEATEVVENLDDKN